MRELETQLEEVENQQVELETKSTVMKALQEGQVPEVQQPIVAEPIVKTVEVSINYNQSWNFQISPEVPNCPSLIRELRGNSFKLGCNFQVHQSFDMVS